MENNINFWVIGKLAFLAPASPELGTAQPQLVMVFILFKGRGGYVRERDIPFIYFYKNCDYLINL